ncbi:MAG: cupin domain-containing protein [Rubrobacter sp.]|nr:cupin domain-containing protein [Rubrobacter sp.]
MTRDIEPKELFFEDDGKIPNNPELPLLLYPGVLEDDELDPLACKKLLAENGWTGAWVNGVFSYHHYHSTAHEVLAVVGGSARITFGGEAGETVEVEAGDIVAIPAGVGHFNAGSSADFTIVGAYPEGQSWDLLTGEPDERPKALENIRNVPLPNTDPLFGSDGPLVRRWSEG